MKGIYQAVKGAVEEKLYWIVGALLVIQPPLDVLSYFLAERGNNSFSTALRFLMLMAVALLGFLVSDRKRIYVIVYGLMGLFWAAHVVNCYRIGYQSMVADTANYLRIMNFPIFTLSFITFFQKGDGMRKVLYTAVAIDLGEIILFTAIPWLIGQPVYTYEILQLGVMGWFSVANAQSAIVVLVAPLAILFAWKTKKYLVFLLALVLSFGLMFITGTKFTFYSIFIIAGAFIFLFVLQYKKQSLRFVLPLLGVLVLVVGFRNFAPMRVRESMSQYALNNYQQLVEESLKNSGADTGTLEEIKEELEKSPGNTPSEEERIQRLRDSLIGVYTDPEVYGPFFESFYKRFGVYNVMEAYNYTSDSSILSDSRVRKSMFAKLMWEEKDTLTHLLGFEYSDMLYEGDIFDLENDFPAVFYFCGYIGFGLYMAFFALFVVMIFKAFGQDVAAAWKAQKGKKRRLPLKSLASFGGGVQRFLTVEMGAVGMMFLLAAIAAQISGNVLRRPNVTVYFAVAAAYLCYLTMIQRKKQQR